MGFSDEVQRACELAWCADRDEDFDDDFSIYQVSSSSFNAYGGSTFDTNHSTYAFASTLARSFGERPLKAIHHIGNEGSKVRFLLPVSYGVKEADYYSTHNQANNKDNKSESQDRSAFDVSPENDADANELPPEVRFKQGSLTSILRNKGEVYNIIMPPSFSTSETREQEDDEKPWTTLDERDEGPSTLIASRHFNNLSDGLEFQRKSGHYQRSDCESVSSKCSSSKPVRRFCLKQVLRFRPLHGIRWWLHDQPNAK